MSFLRSFPTASMLEFHVLKAHTQSAPYVCPHCARGFMRPSDLSRHLRLSHSDTHTRVHSHYIRATDGNPWTTAGWVGLLITVVYKWWGFTECAQWHAYQSPLALHPRQRWKPLNLKTADLVGSLYSGYVDKTLVRSHFAPCAQLKLSQRDTHTRIHSHNICASDGDRWMGCLPVLVRSSIQWTCL